ncbi:ATP-dependent RNA helicase ROK1, partial [Aduncisulcus paluster]
MWKQLTQGITFAKNSKLKPKKARGSLAVSETVLYKKKDQSTIKEDLGIKSDIEGSEIMLSFESLISKYEWLLPAITKQEWTIPTPVQAACIPSALENRDIIAIAETGSGKTGAFLLPLIAKLQSHSKLGVRAVILAPTAELVSQIGDELEIMLTAIKENPSSDEKYGDLTVACLKSYDCPGIKMLKRGKKTDVIISSPLRLINLLRSELISFDTLEYIVLDEVDRLLDKQFIEQTDEVMESIQTIQRRRIDAMTEFSALSEKKQKKAEKKLSKKEKHMFHISHTPIQIAFFSATMSSTASALALSITRDPVRVDIGDKCATTKNVDHKLVFCGDEKGKLTYLRNLLPSLSPPTLVFVDTKERAAQLYTELVYDEHIIETIHGSRSHAEREAILKAFHQGSVWMLICTDLIARGLDFKGVNTVINYDTPKSREVLVHRAGRSGRQTKGTCVTMFTEDDVFLLGNLLEVFERSGTKVPSWMLAKKEEWLHRERGLRHGQRRKLAGRGVITTQRKADRSSRLGLKMSEKKHKSLYTKKEKKEEKEEKEVSSGGSKPTKPTKHKKEKREGRGKEETSKKSGKRRHTDSELK